MENFINLLPIKIYDWRNKIKKKLGVNKIADLLVFTAENLENIGELSKTEIDGLHRSLAEYDTLVTFELNFTNCKKVYQNSFNLIDISINLRE